jgi:hypothetical protein
MRPLLNHDEETLNSNCEIVLRYHTPHLNDLVQADAELVSIMNLLREIFSLFHDEKLSIYLMALLTWHAVASAEQALATISTSNPTYRNVGIFLHSIFSLSHFLFCVPHYLWINTFRPFLLPFGCDFHQKKIRTSTGTVPGMKENQIKV